jgi:osmotically-inducible protein OsmY
VDDDTLRREVHEQLARQEALANVHPKVKDGVVYLQGSVPTQAARTEARKVAESVQGVRGVKEELTINPHSGAAASSTTGVERRR